MIVHRRLDTFDRRARITTWLFGICMRVAANYRRRRRWTHEVLSGGFEDERPATLAAADDILVRREQRELAERALNRLEVAKRATFVMFEIESLSCHEIAELMNVPVGTVYSRLHSARRQLEKTPEPRSRAARCREQLGGWRATTMSDPRRWRDDRSGATEILLRGARRPQLPDAHDLQRLGAAVDEISRARPWAGVVAAPRGGGRVRVRDRRRRHVRLGAARARHEAPGRDGRGRGKLGADVGARAPVERRPRRPRARSPGPPAASRSRRHATRAEGRRRRARCGAGRRRDREADDSLAREVPLIDEGRADLATAPSRALAVLETHRREFPHGQLAAEREFLAVQALLQMNRMVDAKKRADDLAVHYPSSSYAARAARLIEDAEAQRAAGQRRTDRTATRGLACSAFKTAFKPRTLDVSQRRLGCGSSARGCVSVGACGVAARADRHPGPDRGSVLVSLRRSGDPGRARPVRRRPRRSDGRPAHRLSAGRRDARAQHRPDRVSMDARRRREPRVPDPAGRRPRSTTTSTSPARWRPAFTRCPRAAGWRSPTRTPTPRCRRRSKAPTAQAAPSFDRRRSTCASRPSR